MGSFDEAIREHLDLKRRRGASLREVENMEREALSSDPPLGWPAGPFDRDSFIAHDARADPSHAGRVKARRNRLSQETVEIDMATIIEAHRVDDQREHRAYDWDTEEKIPDIGDPSSSFDWETPERTRVRGAA